MLRFFRHIQKHIIEQSKVHKFLIYAIMKMPFIICLFVSVLMIVVTTSFYSTQLFAQSENIIFRNITPDDGLPVTTVTDVTQDSFGYIWIGSWDGVYRYDGNTFEKKSDQGRYVVADKKGGVWISYNRDGIAAYYSPQTDSLTYFDVESWTGRFPRLAIDAAGTVWAESENGLEYFNESTHSFEKDSVVNSEFTHGQLIAHKNGAITFFYLEPNVKWGIGHRSENGSVQYDDFPLDQNNPDPSQPFNTSSIPNMERYLDNGILLINSFGWAYKEDYDSEWIFVKPDRPEILSDQGDIITHNNDLLVQHPNALTKFNIQTGTSVTNNHNPLNPKSILPAEEFNAGTRLFIDKQEVLWVPFFSYGFSRLNLYESDFSLLRSEDGTPIPDVISAVELEDGAFWVGTRFEEDGLLRFDADGNIVERYSGPLQSPPGKSVSDELSHPFIWSLASGSDGSIWAGGGSTGPNRGGINRIRPDSDLITRFKHDPNDEASLPGDWIFNLIEDGSGRIWAGTDEGYAWIDPQTEIVTRHRHPAETGIPMDERPFSLKTDDGDIVFSSPTNVYYRLNHEDLSIEPINLRIEDEESTMIRAQDENGRFWAENSQGLGILDSSMSSVEKWFYYVDYDVPFSDVSGFQFDSENNIWLATDYGIAKFEPESETFTYYSYERGLQGYNYPGYLNYKGPSGKIYFSGSGGINIFDPDQIQVNPHPPQMVFTGLRLDGEPVQAGPDQPIQKPIQLAEEIVIEPEISSINFEFAAMHFGGDKSNQYQYMLEGFDSDWRSGGSVGQATYTSLAPGEYTFRIKGSNLDGVWSDGSKSISLAVLPPWWRTWWAYGFYFMLFIAGIIAADRIQRRRVQQKEREKTREKELAQAKEIEKAYKNLEIAHEDLKAAQDQLVQQEKLASLGQLTAGIAHEIKNPLNFVNNFSELSTELIQEIREEIRSVGTNHDLSLYDVYDILNDIEANLKSIHKHGTRADGIVKSMLEHSRGGSGKIEPTDLNQLIKEFTNLSFHGMRAGKNSINVDMEFDLDESIGDVPLIAEDFSRVIINLCNNAFDAMQYKLSALSDQPSASYKPKLTVRTKSENQNVVVEVEDNGPGIPDEMKDKILQPFFTTKKGTEGTGLGLSITNDIIKAHGGTVQIQSKNNEFTLFRVTLT